MLDSCTTAQERWGGVHKLIDRWLAERKQLVQQYTELCETAEANKTTATLLESFCDILVDYVSAGHFEVYEQLIREAEEFQDQGGLDLARQLYPRIETITQSAVQFNDQYGRAGPDGDSELMHGRLLQLGGLLHERFELEDCLIEVLHTAHQDMLSTH
jgi:regulator of sigma D